MTSLLAHIRTGDWLTLRRLKVFAVVFALVSLVGIAGDVWVHTRFGVVNGEGEQLGRDFVNYWAGPRLAMEGQAQKAYDLQWFWDYERSLTAPNAEFKWYGYPPVAMVLAAPFALLPFLPAFAAWTLSGWAVLTGMLSRRLTPLWAGLAVLALPAFKFNTLFGQNGAFTAALLAGGILLLESSPILAGILFGALCYKPHLGVLIPIAMLAAGRWKTIFSAAATVSLLVAISLIWTGVPTWEGFVQNTPFHKRILETQGLGYIHMPSVYLMLRRIAVDSPIAYGLQAVSSLLAAWTVFTVWKSAASKELKGAVLLVATFVATPYVWDYDLIALLFASVWLWAEAERTEWRPWEKTALVVMLALPGLASLVVVQTGLQPGPFAMWWVLILMVRRATEPQKLVSA
jgi:hypothetical protein